MLRDEAVLFNKAKKNVKLHTPDITTCMGKLPFQTEFIKQPVHHLRFVQLDHWYQTAYQQLIQNYSEQGKKIFATAGLQHFVLMPNCKEAPLIGTLMPSQDLNGRCYPFVLARIANDSMTKEFPALIPQLYQNYFRVSTQICQQSYRITNLAEFLNQFGQLERELPSNTKKEILNTVLNNLNTIHVDVCWKVLRQSQPDYQKKQFILAICELLLIQTQWKKEKNPAGWRLPLFDNKIHMTAIIFWLQLLLQIMGMDISWSAFWDEPSVTSVPALKLYFGDMLPQDLIFILDPTRTQKNYFTDFKQLNNLMNAEMPSHFFKKFADNASLLTALNNFSDKGFLTMLQRLQG